MTHRPITRRAALLGAAAAVGTLGLSGVASAADRRPVALVYRGPASVPGCPESVAALLAHGPTPLRPVYCGPQEAVRLSASSLAGAALYAQPGGGDLGDAWPHLRARAGDVRAFVRRGGRYLGFCLGGYLAGRTPGFDLLPGDTDEYVGSPGATVPDERDAVIVVTWSGRRRSMFFQDGPRVVLSPPPPRSTATVLATYDNGTPAAVIAPYGCGKVGVVGPHPEADASWYIDADLTNPEGVRFDLGHDLVTRVMAR